MMSLKDVMCGDGEGVSKPDARRTEGVKGFGSDFESEDPRLPGDINLEMSSTEPSFSHRCPSSCV